MLLHLLLMISLASLPSIQVSAEDEQKLEHQVSAEDGQQLDHQVSQQDVSQQARAKRGWSLEYLYTAIQHLFDFYLDGGRVKIYYVKIDTGTTQYEEEVTFYFKNKTVVRKNPAGIVVEDFNGTCLVACPNANGTCYVVQNTNGTTFEEELTNTQALVALQKTISVSQLMTYVQAAGAEPITRDDIILHCSPGVLNLILANHGLVVTTISTKKRSISDKYVKIYYGQTELTIYLGDE